MSLSHFGCTNLTLELTRIIDSSFSVGIIEKKFPFSFGDLPRIRLTAVSEELKA